MGFLFSGVLIGLPHRGAAAEVLYEQPVRAESLPIIVPVNFDGESIPMILDTGASVHFVDTSMQSHLHGFVAEKAATAANSDFRAKTWESPAMRVGAWKLPVATVVPIDFATPRSAVGVDIRGVLGRPALEDVAVEVNFDEGKLRFLRDYVPPDSTKILRPGEKLSRMSYVPMDPDEVGNPCVRVEIGGVPIRVLIDTGAVAGFGLRTETFEKLVAAGAIARLPDSENLVSATADGVATTHTGKFTAGTALGIDLKGVPVEDSFKVDVLGLLFLENFNFVYDPTGRRFCFEKRHAEPPIDYTEMIGAGFIFPEGTCRVYFIDAGPAMDAGMRKNDKILRLGPLRKGEINKSSVYELFEASAGQALDVEYSRDGEDQVFKARLKLSEKKFMFPPQP